ncbi:uncharacterized protein N7443_006255 [Penicillium atrosanguineum]|uniref:uncharacterized protein n=1 Tax=Penicillium atrosanguineum TaxID=1132637 RepID=UPI00238B14FB|nr:uncharacterized protein N7443_006255 [Penicillium atrosanguineum]KAJ5298135.1 hypothetical protein N7443_006255 [Penicillium atrosanguineum]
MKTSISSCVWERKKALISTLYVEEEWPLKHVLKQIRSDDFNPSETQLRSRLRKWRATKLSRKIRRPPGYDSGDGESEKDEKGSSATPPHNEGPSPGTKGTSTTGWDWSGLPACALLDVQSQPIDQKRKASMAQQLVPSPLVENFHTSDRSHAARTFRDLNPPATSFEQPVRTSPVAKGLIVSTTFAVMPSTLGYPVYPGSCILNPMPTTNPTMAAWPPCPVSPDLGLNPTLQPGWWYSMAFEATNTPPGVPHSASGDLSVSYHQEYIPVAVPLSPGAYPLELAHYRTYEPRHWKSDFSLEYDYHGRLKHGERKPLPPHQPYLASMVPLPYSATDKSNKGNWPSYCPEHGPGPDGAVF